MKKFVFNSRLTKIKTNSFRLYLKEVSEIKTFTVQEEEICAKKASNGDKEAIDELVTRNLRFVITVAKQYEKEGLELEDLINEGNIGLLMAAEKFKPEMGFKFISYAIWWIRKIMMEHISKNGKAIRIPANKINDLYKFDREINKLEQKLSREVTINDLLLELDGKESKKTIEEYIILNSINQIKFKSLDSEVFDEQGNGTRFSDLITDKKSFKPTDHSIITQDIRKQIENALEILKPRDKYIVSSMFGLDGETPKTLQDLSDEIGLTREMIRQIKEKSLIKLKKKLSGQDLTEVEF